MHHCNIMYPSCDTIYTGVMLNVEIARTNLLFVFPSAVFFRHTFTNIIHIPLTIFIVREGIRRGRLKLLCTTRLKI